MGLYDVIVYKCPFCKNMTESQTKQFNQSMSKYKIGDTVNSDNFRTKNCIMIMAYPCEKCGKYSAIEIKNNKLKSIKHPKEAVYKDLGGGYIEKIVSGERYEK